MPMTTAQYASETDLTEFLNVGYTSINTKHDIPIAEWHTIDAVGIVVILRTRILRKNASKGSRLHLRKLRQAAGRDDNLKRLPPHGICKASPGIGMSIGIWEVRLYVKDGSAVHKVSTEDVDDRTIRSVIVDMREAHARETDGIGAKRRPRGEDTETLVAPKTRGTHRQSPCLMLVGRKLPYYPQIVKILKTTNSIAGTITLIQDYRPREFCYQTTLARNTKL